MRKIIESCGLYFLKNLSAAEKQKTITYKL